MEDRLNTTEEALRFCINENFGKVNVVRVELCGIAKFACWWFVIWSILGSIAGFIALATR